MEITTNKTPKAMSTTNKKTEKIKEENKKLRHILKMIIETVEPVSVEMTSKGAVIGSKGMPSDQSIYDAIQILNTTI